MFAVEAMTENRHAGYLYCFDGGAPLFILGVSTFALALFLFRVGAMPLTDPDEGRYAEIAHQMARSDDWLVPQLFGQPYLEKPPLLYWITAAAFRGLGPSEFAARITPAAAAAFGVLAAGLFARRHFSAAAGMLASAVLGSSAFYVAIARTLVTDMLFTVTIAGSLFSFFAYREERATRLGPALAFWCFLGAATLSKGPAAVVICGLVIAIDALLGGAWRVLLSPRLLLSAPVYLAIALPWFALVQRTYPEFLSFYLWKEHLERAAGSEHAEPIYWFVPWILGGLLPWTPFAAVAAPKWWKTAHEGSVEGRAVRFLLVWSATVFVIFSASRGKLATYVLPIFPPLAVLVASFLDGALRDRVEQVSIGRAVLATGAVFFLVGFGLAIASSFLLLDPWTSGVALVVAACVAAAIATFLCRRSRVAQSVAAILAGAVAVYLALAEAAPVLSRSFTARPLVDIVAKQITSTDSYALWGKYLPSAAFYLDRPPLLIGTRPELRFGKSLVGNQPNIVSGLGELNQRTKGGRLYVFTDNRPKRERELREALGDIRLLAQNYVAAVWLRP